LQIDAEKIWQHKNHCCLSNPISLIIPLDEVLPNFAYEKWLKKENFAYSKKNPYEDNHGLLIDAHRLLVSSILIEIQAKSESKNEISQNYLQ
jgi:hypothetical protein